MVLVNAEEKRCLRLVAQWFDESRDWMTPEAIEACFDLDSKKTCAMLLRLSSLGVVKLEDISGAGDECRKFNALAKPEVVDAVRQLDLQEAERYKPIDFVASFKR